MTELKNTNGQIRKKRVKSEDKGAINELPFKVDNIELKLAKVIETSKLNSKITSIQFGNVSNQSLSSYILLGTDKGELIVLNNKGEKVESKKLYGLSNLQITSLKLIPLMNGSNQENIICCQTNGKVNILISLQITFQLEIQNSPTALEKVDDSNNGYYLVIGDNSGKLTGFNFKEKLFQFLLKEPKLTFLNDNTTPDITLETCNNPIDQLLQVIISDFSNNLSYYYLITNFTKKCYIYSKSTHIHTLYFENEITRMTTGRFTELTTIKYNNESSKLLDILISDKTGQVFLLSDLKPTPYFNHGTQIKFMLPYRIKDQPKEISDYLIVTDYSDIIFIYQNQKLITKLNINAQINQLLTISTNGFYEEKADFESNLENNYTDNDSILLTTKDSDLLILSADLIKMETGR